MIVWLLGLLPFFMVSGGVDFQTLDIGAAISKARQENKFVFIDTYATWCKPCKQMDVVLADAALGDFVNDHFISIKIDMDGPEGEIMEKKYGVVWLPTVVILDQDGSVKNKIDRLLTANELLTISKRSVESLTPAQTSALYSDPFQSVNLKRVEKPSQLITEENAPVIYVYDEKASSGRPHIMYHEAYLHMQLMDGRQDAVVKKYLSTQDDWSTEKNIQFIFDFLQSTDSKEFKFFIDNKIRFEELIGKEKVDQSLEVLVYQKLHNGYPRPDLEQVRALFGYIDPTTSEERAYSYYLNRLSEEERDQEFVEIADDYIARINPYDHEIIFQFIQLKMSGNFSEQDLNRFLKLMETALILDELSPHYLVLIANLYLLKSDKSKAGYYCRLAREMPNLDGEMLRKLEMLEQKITGL